MKRTSTEPAWMVTVTFGDPRDNSPVWRYWVATGATPVDAWRWCVEHYRKLAEEQPCVMFGDPGAWNTAAAKAVMVNAWPLTPEQSDWLEEIA